jgi:hypothetical protein
VSPGQLANIYRHSEDRNAPTFRVTQSKKLIKLRKNVVSATQFILRSTLNNISKMLAAFYRAINGLTICTKENYTIIWVHIKHRRIPNFSLCIFRYSNPHTPHTTHTPTHTHKTQFRSFIRPPSTVHDYETCRIEITIKNM